MHCRARVILWKTHYRLWIILRQYLENLIQRRKWYPNKAVENSRIIFANRVKKSFQSSINNSHPDQSIVLWISFFKNIRRQRFIHILGKKVIHSLCADWCFPLPVTSCQNCFDQRSNAMYLRILKITKIVICRKFSA